DSILAVQLARRLEHRLQRPFTPTTLFQFPTIQKLAQQLAEGGATVVEPSVPPITAATPRPSRSKQQHELRDEIAIIGMACRFPGANSPLDLWRNVRLGIDSVTQLSAEALERRFPGQQISTAIRGGFLSDVAGFDYKLFRLSLREARLMDPQQRLLLEVAWEALEQAACLREPVTSTGVFIGASTMDYAKLAASPTDQCDPHTRTGNALSMLANRISYLLNLEGPSLTVDTACSSSLVAIHLACQSLLTGESDAAIAGGVHINLNPLGQEILEHESVLARDGRCKAFDMRADGFGRGEGVGVVVLKSLNDAIRDRDFIWATIRGTATNNDGNSKASLSAPNPRSQARVIAAAHRTAGIAASDIGYVEAHGTGTPLGDPIEIVALQEAFAGNSRQATCALGTIKTNMGHLEAAAGVAGLMRAALAVHFGEIPPSLHFSAPNSQIQFENSPFYFADQLRPWPSATPLRLAAVSSFGLGGANAHTVIAAPPTVNAASAVDHWSSHVTTLSAATPESLRKLATRLSNWLDQNPLCDIADVNYSLNSGRVDLKYRLAVVASSRAELSQRLKAFADSAESAALKFGEADQGRGPRIAMVFPDHSEQLRQNLIALSQFEPQYLESLKSACQSIAAVSGANDFDWLLDDSDSPPSKSQQELNLLCGQIALFEMWRRWGIEPTLLLGQGAGVYAAAYCAGASPHEIVRAVADNRAVDLTEATDRESLTIPFAILDDNGAWRSNPARAESSSVESDISNIEVDFLLPIGAEPNLQNELPRPRVLEWPSNPNEIQASLGLTAATLFAAGQSFDWRQIEVPSERYRLPLPTYSFEHERVWFDSAQVDEMNLAQQAANGATAADDQVCNWLCEPVWQLTPETPPRDLAPSRWLIFADDFGIATHLARELTSFGQQCVLVFSGDEYRQLADDVFAIAPGSELQHRQLSEQFTKSGFTPDHFAFLWACEPSRPETAQPPKSQGFSTGVRSLFHIARTYFTDQPQSLWVVTCTADFASADSWPGHAMVPVFAQGLAADYPSLSTRTIEIATTNQSPRRLATTILNDILRDGDATAARYTDNGCHLRDIRRASRQRLSPSTPCEPGGVYLITGGLGDVGLQIARWLATRGPARLALISRAVLPPRLDWPSLLAEYSGSDLARRITAIIEVESLGAQVHVVSADVADAASLVPCLDQIERLWGGIDGVFHCAGLLKDSATWNNSLAQIEEVLRPKVEGAWLLHTLTERFAVRTFVCMSSTASLASLPGQAAYAAANAFMDALCHHRHARGLPALSINWGVWQGTRAVANERYLQFIEASGARILSADDNLRCLEAALRMNAPQVAILPDSPAAQTNQRRHDDAAAVNCQKSAAVIAASVNRSLIGEAQRLADRLDEYSRFGSAIDAACIAIIRQSLFELGLDPQHSLAASDSLQVAGVQPRFERVVARFRAIFAGHSSHADSRSGSVMKPQERVATPLDQIRELRNQFPFAAAQCDLLERCANQLTSVLRGETDPLELLFPDGDYSNAEAVYHQTEFAQLYNLAVASAVRTAIETVDRPPLRLLEIGGGTGGLAETLLPLLRRGDAYTFTDLSPAFLARAERKLASQSTLNLRLLDIERNPDSQGFAPGAFDLVIAANVLHATRNLRQTLAYVRQLLAPGGLLLLVEATRSEYWIELTFGLMEGWWRFDDFDVRQSGPLLPLQGWRQVLSQAGFDVGGVFPDKSTSLSSVGQHLLLCQSIRSAEGAAAPADAMPSSGASTHRKQEVLVDAGRASAVSEQAFDLVRATFASVLRIPADNVAIDLTFQDQGLDSLLALELVGKLRATLVLKSLSPTVLYQYPTIEALAKFLAQSHEASVSAWLRQHAPSMVEGAGESSAVPSSPLLRSSQIVLPVPARQCRVTPIAVVGYACRVPGGEDAAGYWRLLAAGRDATGSPSAARWRLAGQPPQASARGGFLEGIDQFDPLFFRLSPLEASQMDPRQRLFLETAYAALEHAGYGGEKLRATRTGVFVGTAGQDYLAGAGAAGIGPHWATGSSAAILASRLSYFLDLTGPTLPVDTACSASLVATHLAVESLARGECDYALAGGAQLNLWLKSFAAFAQMGALAPGGRCRPFDQRADGFIPAEGVAALLLRPLADALAAGDTIHAVILGSAVNNDGRTNGLTAPNPAAQRAALCDAWRDAGVAPDSLDYLEAHGTGTALGDPIEVEGFASACALFTPRKQFCQLGSVKSNLGHAESAAGLVGLVKTLLALEQEQLPPTLHLQDPNRHIAWEETPLAINDRLRPWPRRAERPRRAGVSAFGFGGTNAHVVLEEAPLATPLADANEPHPLCLSARTPQALRQLAQRYADHLETTEQRLADIGHTAATGRFHLAERLALVAATRAEAAMKLRRWLAGDGAAGSDDASQIAAGSASGRRPRLAFLFSGQGGSHAGMGEVLYRRAKIFRQTIDRADAVLR
ncbi:MAG: SDR family oxidoreductase, partial [Pirellulales bacterium]|nr:SDR family oxidoreductase [Pirellulales bacterium]